MFTVGLITKNLFPPLVLKITQHTINTQSWQRGVVHSIQDGTILTTCTWQEEETKAKSIWSDTEVVT